ncbi:hypothetical protein HD806DRAFT_523799 [Xylariaceae sp. AK1471]|nr:hypothetical protein HD806DRAFT_523799 [Xylariaceae sp. AK1471]
MRAIHLIAVASIIWSAVAKRGGGGGGGGGSSGGGDYGGSSGSGGGGDGGDDDGGSYTPPPPPPPCDQGACVCAMIDGRMDLYELPGLYYNGTITVSHKLVQNSAWDAERLHPNDGQMCKPNNDDAVKTYKYPALFYIGPQGNDSDTNTVHWALRGYQPPEQMSGDQYLDIYERWIHLRSSDYVVTDNSTEAYYFGQYEYYASDETGRHRETHTYWDTTVSQGSGNTYSVVAEYVSMPSEIPLSQSSYAALPKGTGPRSSQYITLSDVCYYDQEGWGISTEPMRPSYIPKGNDYIWTTTPTMFLGLGAKASMSGIGANSMQFSMRTTIANALALVSPVQASCDDAAHTYYTRFSSNFNVMHWIEASEYNPGNLWNMTVDVQLVFEGDIVSENSTKITGFEDGTPIFEKQIERNWNDTWGSPTGVLNEPAQFNNELDLAATRPSLQITPKN